MTDENIEQDLQKDFITCARCGNMYLMGIAIELGYDDLIDTMCHHCLHYSGDISEDEFTKVSAMES